MALRDEAFSLQCFVYFNKEVTRASVVICSSALRFHLVRTHALLCQRTFPHHVRERVHMARRLPNLRGHDDGGFEAHHVVAKAGPRSLQRVAGYVVGSSTNCETRAQRGLSSQADAACMMLGRSTPHSRGSFLRGSWSLWGTAGSASLGARREEQRRLSSKHEP